MNKLDAALAWAARGFRVFPCAPNTRQPIAGFGDWWLHATSDPDVIRSIWYEPFSGQVRDYNIGCDTTDMAVVDVDTKHGAHALTNYYSVGGHFDTLTVQSQSGGWHAYFNAPAPVANSQGSLVKDVDVRGHHGIILAPGSTIDGREYRLARDVPMAPLPDDIFKLCKPPRDRNAEAQHVAVAEVDAASAVAAAEAFLTSVQPAISGQGGNNQTFQVAARARDLGLSEGRCVDLMLLHFNERCDPPWTPDELRQIIHNCYEYAENPIGYRSPEALLGGVPVLPEPPPAPNEPTLAEVRDIPTIRFGNLIGISGLLPRPWLYKGLLEREEATLLLAPGAIGKSLATLEVALHLALGLPMWGFANMEGKRIASVIYNAEDSLNEMSMRLHAACIQKGICVDDVAPYICLISGKTHGKLRLVTMNSGAPSVNGPAVEIFMSLCSNPEVGLLIADPLVALHECNENDNVQMNLVLETITWLLRRAGVAGLIPHHMSKPPQANYTGYIGNPDASRGAGGIVMASRVALTMSAPPDEDVVRYGLAPFQRQRLVRLDDGKLNRGLKRGEPVWLHKHTVRLPNGEEVGAFSEANIKDMAQDMRLRVARTFYAELSARASASISLTDATALLMRLDPIWGQINPAQVRNRIETMLTEPADLGGMAGTISLHVKDGRKNVVLAG